MWINLLTEFRVSLFKHLFVFHTHPGWMNEWIDLVSAWLIEYKAFTVFSFLFGVGIAVQTERSDAREVRPSHFMLRRFGFSWVSGCSTCFHVSGDILCLYAISGVLVAGVRRLPIRLLIALSVAMFSLGSPGFCEIYSARRRCLTREPIHSGLRSRDFQSDFRPAKHEAFHFTMPLLLAFFHRP